VFRDAILLLIQIQIDLVLQRFCHIFCGLFAVKIEYDLILNKLVNPVVADCICVYHIGKLIQTSEILVPHFTVFISKPGLRMASFISEDLYVALFAIIFNG